MNLTKTSIAAIVATTIGSPLNASADTINFTFTGLFTLASGTDSINGNDDAAVTGSTSGPFDLNGSRTPYTGSGTFDTVSGLGSADINAFSFFGSGLFDVLPFSFKALGDGMGGSGTLIGAAMAYNWNGSNNTPITAVMDASGFFTSILGTLPGAEWSVEAGCFACAISATPDTFFGHQVGAVPIAMTTFNTAGTTLDSLLPLNDDYGKSGSPSTTAPITGAGFDFDFTSINATNQPIPSVPVPAAVWLFSSGLMGLVGVARRRRHN